MLCKSLNGKCQNKTEQHLEKPNIIVVLSDTLRTAYLGCYGNKYIHTPCIDEFAKQSLIFTRAYPESLPTIPVRRALHTGRRVYPFKDYKPVKWDIVYLPGWQPISNEEDTLSENLADAGYQTGFITDTLPYFTPGFNFQRGFWQWEYIRGQQQDRWKSPYSVPKERLQRYGSSLEEFKNNMHTLIPMHLANTAEVNSEEDTTTARVFKSAMNFLEDNSKAGQPFYLLVDCFDPHEPWDAPEKYYRMYGDPNYNGKRIVACGYGPAGKYGYTEKDISYVKAQYCGLVTLVDTWFGQLMKKLDTLGLRKNTAIFFLSDHGTNFCENPRNIIGKPSNSMYPGVMHLPFIAALPRADSNGKTCDELIYNIDLTATIYDIAGIKSSDGIDGQSLLPLLMGSGLWKKREYITCRYANSISYIDRKNWILTDLDRRQNECFDLENDLNCQNDISKEVSSKCFDKAWNYIRYDAGGDLINHGLNNNQTDAIGQKV